MTYFAFVESDVALDELSTLATDSLIESSFIVKVNTWTLYFDGAVINQRLVLEFFCYNLTRTPCTLHKSFILFLLTIL